MEPVEILSSAEAAELDRRAEAAGLPEPSLMEAAGRLVAVAVRRLLGERVAEPDLGVLVPSAHGRRMRAHRRPAGGGGEEILVLAGPGRNGGDGLVAARYLRSWGHPVRVLLAADADRLAGHVAACWRALGAHGVPATVLGGGDGTAAAVAEAVGRAACVVDALLGTGARLPLRPPVRGVVEAVNAALGQGGERGRSDRAGGARPVPVLAVDVPTGADGDTGEVPGPCIAADATVTFFRPKPGLLLGPAALAAGELWLGRIPIPESFAAGEAARLRLLTPAGLAGLLPPRPADAHKGRFGHVLVVAGAVGYGGAAALAAQGALRAGAGLVTLMVPEPLWSPLAGKLTEVMVRPLPADEGGGLAARAVEALAPFLGEGRTVVAGPGLGRGEGARAVLRFLLEESPGPLVLDADALNLLTPGEMALCRAPLVVTPHPGEMGRLLGRTAEQVQADRLGAARAAWEALGGDAGPGRVVVLKGWRTLVAAAGRTWINPTGNEGLATAGTGDVLAGLIGGLLAQGGDVEAAACAGVFVHGLAGDLAAARSSSRAVTAGDVLSHLGEAWRQVERCETDAGRDG